MSAGGTANHDMTLGGGAVLTGTFTDRAGRQAVGGWLMARNSFTGDVVGAGWLGSGPYRMSLAGGQAVHLTYEVRFGDDWHRGTVTGVLDPPAPRGTVLVPPTGTLTRNIVVTID